MGKMMIVKTLQKPVPAINPKKEDNKAFTA